MDAAGADGRRGHQHASVGRGRGRLPRLGDRRGPARPGRQRHRRRRRGRRSRRGRRRRSPTSRRTPRLPYGNSFMDNDTLFGGGSQRVYAFTSYPEHRGAVPERPGRLGDRADQAHSTGGWRATTRASPTGRASARTARCTRAASPRPRTVGQPACLPALTNDLLGARPTGARVQHLVGAAASRHGDLGARAIAHAARRVGRELEARRRQHVHADRDGAPGNVRRSSRCRRAAPTPT